MINLQRLSTEPSPLLRSAILASGVVSLLATSGPQGIQKSGAAPRTDISAPAHPTTLAGESQLSSVLNDALGQTDGAMNELAGAIAEALIALDKPGPFVEAASINSPNSPSTQSTSMQVASADPSDLEIGGANKAPVETVDECLVMEICVDRYLWALYQRTPKEDTIKVPERRNVSVKRKGRMVTVTRTFTKLVDHFFHKHIQFLTKQFQRASHKACEVCEKCRVARDRRENFPFSYK